MSEIVTLKENRAFSLVYRKGKNFVDQNLVTYVLKTNTKNVQIGITTSKKIGNAVKRARARRIIRAALQKMPSIREGNIIVFVARTRTTFIKSTELEDVMKKHLRESGAIL